MVVEIGNMVMQPRYAPYPRYGRVVELEEGHRVRVTDVHCGDPRCDAEHQHGDDTWELADLLAAQAYQARAGWEEGRKSSPHAPAAR